MKYVVSILLLCTGLSLSQQTKLEYIKNISDKDSVKSSIKIFLSGGAGFTAYKPAFVLSPNIIVDLHQHFNIATGVDFYFKSKEYDNFVSYNLIPYYVIRSRHLTFLRLGLGIALYKGHNYSPIISLKLDVRIHKNNFLGFEFKSLVPIPPPMEHSTAPPLLLILLNYSIGLP